MQNRLYLFVITLWLAPALAHASVITQINDPFKLVPFAGSFSRASQIDTVAPLALEFITYDNFLFADSGVLTDLEWVGTYQFGAINPQFTISIYNDVGSSPDAVPLYTTVATGSEALLATIGGTKYFSYSTSLPSFSITGGTQYWLSIAANLDTSTNTWGWVNSDLGDKLSIQAGGLSIVRDGVDASFNLTLRPQEAQYPSQTVSSSSPALLQRAPLCDHVCRVPRTS